MKKSRFVQLKNPVIEEWVRVDTKNGRIVGHRKEIYKCPVYDIEKQMEQIIDLLCSRNFCSRIEGVS